MLIGIDGNEANVKERVGVNVWALELLKQFQSLEDKENSFQIYLSRPPLPDMPRETEHWRYRVIPPAKFWTRWRLPLDLYVHSPKPDVFLSLSHYAPKWASMPRVVSIMDLSFLKYREAFRPEVLWQLENWTRESVKNAAHIITISEFNKKEIVKEYHFLEDKITVVYPGVSSIFKGLTFSTEGQTLRNVRKKYDISEKYLLFVGTLQQKKNLPRLIEAFGLIQHKFPDVQLVIAGKIWGQFTTEKYQILLSAPQLKYIGYVPDQERTVLIAGAKALVIPSLYEGFGIPAVEGMSIGTPVAVSNTTSLPEVVGDAGLLFDPYNVSDIADKLRRLLMLTKIERQRMIEKGKIRSKMFRWEKAAEDVLSTVLAVRQGPCFQKQ